MKINQRAWVEMAALDAGTSIRYEVRIDTNGVYIFVVSGDVLIAGSSLHENDAIGLTGLEYADVEAETDAENTRHRGAHAAVEQLFRGLTPEWI